MMKPRLPRQVATRPLTAEDGWRAQCTREATVSPCISLHVRGKHLHDQTVPMFLFIYLFIWLTWLDEVRAKKARCSAALKVDLADSSLNNMVALDWSIMWVDPTVLKAVVHFSLIHTFAFERVETVFILSSVLLNNLCSLLISYCLYEVYNEHNIGSKLVSGASKTWVLLI